VDVADGIDAHFGSPYGGPTKAKDPLNVQRAFAN